MIPLSVLDLVPIREGATISQALTDTADLARAAEAAGYKRFWTAEHHGADGLAGAAVSVVLAHIGHATSTIRIGAGGIMLPNHNPLVIAEQFGTLDALFPGRVDLGLGRAPGADRRIGHALRKDLMSAADNFPQDVVELQARFAGDARVPIPATPGAGAEVEMWILGSSLFGASLAAHLGLPYAFASHFAPQALMQAVSVYRERFEPSKQLDEPYVMVGCNAIVADTEEEAKRLFSTPQQQFTRMVRGTRSQLPPPVDDIESFWSPAEKAHVASMMACSFYGTPATIGDRLAPLIEETGADELMVSAAIWDHESRVRSYELLAQAMG